MSLVTAVRTAVTERLGSAVRRTLIARTGGLDLTKLDKIPRSLAWPLDRVGVDPTPQVAQWREEDPVRRLTSLMGLELWLVTGYDEARQVLGNPAHSTDIRPYVGKSGSTEIGGLGFTDPPEHTRQRKLLTPQFTARRLARIAPLLGQIIEDQLVETESTAVDGVVDLAQTFAFPVPFRVICDLLGLPTSKVIALTGATMPASVPPGGAGELSTMCSYGGPGTAADATATTDPDAPDLGTDDAEKDAEEKTRRQATATGTPSTSATSETSSAAAHPEKTPDTVTASVVAPGGDARTALAAQTTQLGALYACSGLRGPSAGPQAATPPVPGSPIEVKPDPAQVYFDCVATPTGGGTEVHTMLLAGKRLWHLAFVRPGTPRTTQSQLDALAGLHKLALQVPAS